MVLNPSRQAGNRADDRGVLFPRPGCGAFLSRRARLPLQDGDHLGHVLPPQDRPVGTGYDPGPAELAPDDGRPGPVPADEESMRSRLVSRRRPRAVAWPVAGIAFEGYRFAWSQGGSRGGTATGGTR